MYKTMILVRYGESKVEADLLVTIAKSYQKGLFNFIEWRKPYAFIEHISDRTDYRRFQEELESCGITVWLITKQNDDEHHDVIFNRSANKKGRSGIDLLQRLLEPRPDHATK